MLYIFSTEYVTRIKEMLFTHSLNELEAAYLKEKENVPQSLTSQFAEKRSRDDAIKIYNERLQHVGTQLFPSLESQTEAEESLNAEVRNDQSSKQRKAPCCRKCGLPTKGHKACT